MRMENLNRWQWLLLGLCVGMAAGALRVLGSGDYDADITRTLSQPFFEAYVLRHTTPYEYGMDPDPVPEVEVSDLVVHPPVGSDRIDWVTGVVRIKYGGQLDMTDPNSPHKLLLLTEPFRFSITVPYEASSVRTLAMGRPRAGTTNRQYLDELNSHVRDADIEYRYAWWEIPRFQFTVWMVGCGVVIGGLWPFVVDALIGLTLLPPRQRNVSLRHVKSRKRLAHALGTGSKAMTEADRAQLHAVEASLESSLGTAAPPGSAARADSAPASAPLRRLDAGPIEPAPLPPQPEQPREYAGEFYPTVAHAPIRRPRDDS